MALQHERVGAAASTGRRDDGGFGNGASSDSVDSDGCGGESKRCKGYSDERDGLLHL